VENKIHLINFCLNRFCPYIAILFLLFYNSGIDAWKSLAILAFCMFVDRFSYRAGYSVAYCQAKGVNLDDE